MSQPIPSTLHRIAAAAGGGSAAILLINAAKRAEVIPTSAFTQRDGPKAARRHRPSRFVHRDKSVDLINTCDLWNEAFARSANSVSHKAEVSGAPR